MSVLLDTDIVIEIQRGRNPEVAARWTALVASGTSILFPPVVAAETWAGARPQEYLLVQSFFDNLICLPTDYETGRIAGGLLRAFARSHSLDVPDALIAAAAIRHGAALWTRNHKHYPMPNLSFYS